MKKTAKILSVILCMTVLITSFTSVSEAAGGDYMAECAAAAGTITSIIYNATDDQLLYVNNPDGQIEVASITKVVTACVAAQYFNADDILTVGNEQKLVAEDASLAGVYPGETYTFEQLLAAILLPSGCDAAYAIAVNTVRKAKGEDIVTQPDGDAEVTTDDSADTADGSTVPTADDTEAETDYDISAEKEAISEFSAMMNSFCENIGCKDSYWLNPDGQDEERDGLFQHTTISEAVMIAKYAMNIPLIADTVKNFEYECFDPDGNYHYWRSSNEMLNPGSTYYRESVTGIKTGTTDNAGCCLLLSVNENDKTVIIMVAGCGRDPARYELCAELIDIIEPYLAARGDVNHDGVKDVTDARNILRMAIGLDECDDTAAADIDMDGEITVSDARCSLRSAIGLPINSTDDYSL